MSVRNFQLSTFNFQLKNAFGLIEFLVAISILGITAAAITASYLTFERNQRVKNAARTLKSDIRLAQNKALAGDKAIGAETDLDTVHCKSGHTLLGWYIHTVPGNTSYFLSGYCWDKEHIDTSPHTFDNKLVNLPKDIKIESIKCNSSDVTGANIHFHSLTTGVTFHSITVTLEFFEIGSITKHKDLLSDGCNDAGGKLIITLQETTKNTLYKVIVEKSGEVNESK